ncbi:MAG: SUMF1/EgtB/PvdO family nonheme iron enzyme [Treponema sp.]|nr:SUMF1/EgtB/PvdO family nonheme iron enzyme [Treponema sp.]
MKPIMGIRPGVYLSVLYSIILLVILFFFLVFPGLKNPGSKLVVITEPQGAAIRVDGVYMGTAKDKIFVSKGPHLLEVILPGFETESIDAQIPGRTFGSLFFPRRYMVEITFKTDDPSGAIAHAFAHAFAQAAADFAAWSFAGEPTATWQIPLSLSEGAYRTGANNPSAAQILTAAARFTATRAALRDIVRAKMLLDNNGLSPSVAGIFGSVSDILVFLSENPGSAGWLTGLLPAESTAMIKASDWYKKEAASLPNPALQERAGERRLNLAGLSFTSVSNFMICESAVPQAVFETFLNENPEWRQESGASWFAAAEFCKKLTNRLPSSMAGMEVRLPTEAEWEYAAAAGAIKMGEGSWEWCADPFAPLQFIKASVEAVQAVGSPERSLRSSVDSSRTSLPPDFSSPSVSFRPVIVEKDSGY